MIATLLAVWSTGWPQVADHLWQSTLFAGIAAVLALALKRHQARARYWIWIAASLKFLVPFSLLVAMGSHVGWTTAPPIARPPVAVTEAVVVVSQPFSRPPIEIAATPIQDPIASPAPAAAPSVIPAVLLTIWIAGCVAVVIARVRSWRRVSRAIRSASPFFEGRELEALHRVRRAAGLRSSVPLLRSTTTLEPAVVGLFRSALLWPAVVSDELDDAQLEAILAHELSHVNRRDNLAAAGHMVVETVFWFHPVVWWITSRLVDARERACDEAVIAYGADPEVYAEGILKVCRVCLASPLPCVGGVTGSNLTTRIEQIMTDRPARAVKFGKKLLLSALAAAAVCGPIVIGLTHPISVRAQSAIETLMVPVTANVETAAPSQPPIFEPPLAAGVPVTGSESASPVPPPLDAASGATFVLPVLTQQLPPPPPGPQPYVIPADGNIRVTVSPEPSPTNTYSRVYAIAKSDGAITFPDLGHVKVAGLTPRQVEVLIGQELVRRQIFSPAPIITVEVVTYQRNAISQVVYVNGAVRTPGQHILTGDQMTISRAIIDAGGYQAIAGSNVTVLHPLKLGMGIVTDRNDPNVEVHEYDRQLLERSGEDPALHGGDTIIVSRAQVFYINGEVMRAGEKIWKDGATLGDALAIAGGITDKGSLGRSFIRRKDAKGTFREIGKLELETPVLPRDEVVIRKKLF